MLESFLIWLLAEKNNVWPEYPTTGHGCRPLLLLLAMQIKAAANCLGMVRGRALAFALQAE